MTELELLVDLHKPNQHQGPGSDATTAQAIELARLDPQTPLRIADIGCGTGASTLTLARQLNADITAVDFLPDFLDILMQRATDLKLADRITPLEASMDMLPFPDESLDVIWSEGAIYNIGFENGIQLWRPMLKTGGVLAVSEITWLTDERPQALNDHWNREYPEIATASTKLDQLVTHGYAPIGWFPLPTDCWLENYYLPLEAGFDVFLARHDHAPEAQAIIDNERKEIALYRQFSECYSYGFYLARKA